MGKCFLGYLDSNVIYICKQCRAHLSTKSELFSKDFWAGDGKAFLYNFVINTYLGPSEDRELRTGLHSVCDVFCKSCTGKLGWKYLFAFEPSQKYKEGKTILERNHIEKII